MLILSLIVSLYSSYSWAADIAVVDVRRNITLAENDPVYKDFYINAGGGSGLKKNLVVTAVRKVNVRDASGANAVGEIQIPVGQLRIIAIFDRVAVAREYKILSRDELPMLEQTGIMTGDKIDLQGSFIDNSKLKRPKSVSAPMQNAIQPPPERATAALTAEVTMIPVSVNPVDSPSTKAASAAQNAKTPEIVEKTADSGNNLRNE